MDLGLSVTLEEKISQRKSPFLPQKDCWGSGGFLSHIHQVDVPCTLSGSCGDEIGWQAGGRQAASLGNLLTGGPFLLLSGGHPTIWALFSLLLGKTVALATWKFGSVDVREDTDTPCSRPTSILERLTIVDPTAPNPGQPTSARPFHAHQSMPLTCCPSFVCSSFHCIKTKPFSLSLLQTIFLSVFPILLHKNSLHSLQ